MKRTRPNKYSLKKIEQLNEEASIRIALAKRAGGTPVEKLQKVKRNDGSIHTIRRIFCVGGVCELCGKPAKRGEILEPHELIKRSAGGRVSLENSRMCHRTCHPVSKPRLDWIPDSGGSE